VGVDTITGGAGADVFQFDFGQSLVAAPDKITDFAIGTDKIDLFVAPIPTSFSRAVDTASSNSLAAVVAAVYGDANGLLAGNQVLGLNSAALFKVSAGSAAGTYVVVNDSVAGFQSGSDLVINISGYSGALPSLGNIAANSFFI
jgi:hypothetical protein